jgi:hypothetical protein
VTVRNPVQLRVVRVATKRIQHHRASDKSNHPVSRGEQLFLKLVRKTPQVVGRDILGFALLPEFRENPPGILLPVSLQVCIGKCKQIFWSST